jgi:hypothetical protein
MPNTGSGEVTIRRFFLDESGHTGDVADAGAALDFAAQPIFVLACLGVGDEMALAAELDRLRLHHRVQSAELKAKTLGKRLAPFAQDLARFVLAQDWPLFVEIVDKRFYLCIHIVDRLLGADGSGAQADAYSRNVMAEYIREGAPDATLRPYLEACRVPSLEQVREAIAAIRSWLEEKYDQTGRLLQILARLASLRADASGARAIDFLPIADTGPGGKPVWMLPNLQCLTNIYARINQCLGDAIDGVKFVHDDQLQYGAILSDAKAMMEALAAEVAVPDTRFADYRLRGRAELRFATSTGEPCLQAADILAGFAMRHVKASLAAPDSMTGPDRTAFLTLLKACDPIRTTGVNLVLTQSDLDRIGAATL